MTAERLARLFGADPAASAGFPADVLTQEEQAALQGRCSAGEVWQTSEPDVHGPAPLIGGGQGRDGHDCWCCALIGCGVLIAALIVCATLVIASLFIHH